jgi:hypothetical protein
VAFATQAFAQAAVQEPGAFAFYHPDADVLGGRRPPAEAMAALSSPSLQQRPSAQHPGQARSHTCQAWAGKVVPATPDWLHEDPMQARRTEVIPSRFRPSQQRIGDTDGPKW